MNIIRPSLVTINIFIGYTMQAIAQKGGLSPIIIGNTAPPHLLLPVLCVVQSSASNRNLFNTKDSSTASHHQPRMNVQIVVKNVGRNAILLPTKRTFTAHHHSGSPVQAVARSLTLRLYVTSTMQRSTHKNYPCSLAQCWIAQPPNSWACLWGSVPALQGYTVRGRTLPVCPANSTTVFHR